MSAGHDEAAAASDEAHAAFIGSTAATNLARAIRNSPHASDLQRRQAEVIWRAAATRPQRLKELSSRLIERETQQTSRLYSFPYRLNGADIGLGDLDWILRNSRDKAARLRAYEATKASGTSLERRPS